MEYRIIVPDSWLIPRLKKAGIYNKYRSFTPHWCKAYTYTPGTGLNTKYLYENPQ